MDLLWLRKGHLKAEDVTTSHRYSIHDKGGNSSNLLSHLKMHHPILHGFVSQSDNIL